MCGNSLTSLNVGGLSALKYLSCDYNQLTTLDVTGLNALKNLGVQHNNLEVLTLGIPPALNYLYCEYNNLTSLIIQDCPELAHVDCEENQLTSLILNNLPSLTYVNCQYNNLVNLELSNLTSLTVLECNHNSLTTIGLQECPVLQTLDSQDNLLTALDVSANSEIIYLHAQDNPLVYLNIKNGINENSVYVTSDQLQFACIDDNDDTDDILSNSPLAVINSYCSFTPGGQYNTIAGTLSLNNGSSCTNGEPLQNITMNISNGTQSGSTFTNGEGEYVFYANDEQVTITPVVEVPSYFTITPPSITHSFTTGNTALDADFCVTPNGTHNDLEVSMVPIFDARPGFDATYYIIFKNTGTTTQSGTVTLNYNDAVLDYLSSGSSTPVLTTNSLTWEYSTLAPFETRAIEVALNVTTPLETPAVTIDDVLPFTVQVTSSATDETPANNTFNFNQVVIGSYDPNDKQVTEGSAITIEQAGDYLHYLVRFQNTGTAEAINVVVKDMLADNLDRSTFAPVSASHPYRVTLTEGNKAEFIFENINLPAEEDNEPGSHCFIAFKIKPEATVAVGDVLEKNTAEIYFDYNAPIITNTVSTSIEILARADFDFDSHFMLYPNPAVEIVTVRSNDGTGISSAAVYNLLGQLVLSTAGNTVHNDGITVNIAGLQTGTYNIEISSEKGRSASKLVKN